MFKYKSEFLVNTSQVTKYRANVSGWLSDRAAK